MSFDTAARRAALTLHALADEDRAWVLARLQPRQRALVEPLLDELRDLGIVVDPHTLPAIDEANASPATASCRLERLDRDRIAQVARVLEQEAPELARALLAGSDAGWQGALLAAMAPEFAQRVRRLPTVSSAAPALRAALVAAIEGRLAQRQPESKTSRPWWRAWGSRERSA